MSAPGLLRALVKAWRNFGDGLALTGEATTEDDVRRCATAATFAVAANELEAALDAALPFPFAPPRPVYMCGAPPAVSEGGGDDRRGKPGQIAAADHMKRAAAQLGLAYQHAGHAVLLMSDPDPAARVATLADAARSAAHIVAVRLVGGDTAAAPRRAQPFPACVVCAEPADPMALCKGCKAPMCDDCATPRGDACAECQASGTERSEPSASDVVCALGGNDGPPDKPKHPRLPGHGVAFSSYPNGQTDTPERNTAHVCGDVGDRVVNLDFDTSLLYGVFTPDDARALAALLDHVAKGVCSAGLPVLLDRLTEQAREGLQSPVPTYQLAEKARGAWRASWLRVRPMEGGGFGVVVAHEEDPGEGTARQAGAGATERAALLDAIERAPDDCGHVPCGSPTPRESDGKPPCGVLTHKVDEQGEPRCSVHGGTIHRLDWVPEGGGATMSGTGWRETTPNMPTRLHVLAALCAHPEGARTGAIFAAIYRTDAGSDHERRRRRVIELLRELVKDGEARRTGGSTCPVWLPTALEARRVELGALLDGRGEALRRLREAHAAYAAELWGTLGARDAAGLKLDAAIGELLAAGTIGGML